MRSCGLMKRNIKVCVCCVCVCVCVYRFTRTCQNLMLAFDMPLDLSASHSCSSFPSPLIFLFCVSLPVITCHYLSTCQHVPLLHCSTCPTLATRTSCPPALFPSHVPVYHHDYVYLALTVCSELADTLESRLWILP